MAKDTKLQLGIQAGPPNSAGTSEQRTESLGRHGWILNLTGLRAVATVPTALNTYPPELHFLRYRCYPPRSHSPLTPTFLSPEVLEQSL